MTTKIKTFDANQLVLKTTDPHVTELHVSISSSLMTNYEPSRAVDSRHAIEVAEDVNGNPMIFSIGTANELYAILRTADPKAPWRQIDITPRLDKGQTVETFSLLQTPQMTLVLAASVKDSGGNSHFFLTAPLTNDPSDPAWGDDFNRHWVERAFAQAFTSIDHILMSGGPAANDPPVVVATATQASGEAQRYYVNADVTSQLNLWRPWPMPQNASSIIDVAVGTMPVLGAGSFVLYTVGSTLQLDFTTADKMRGQYISRPLTPPPGASALGTLQNADGSTDLYVAGDGVYVFTSHNMSKAAAAQQIATTVKADEGTELTVRQDAANIAVWALVEGILYYLHGTKGDTVTWTTALPVQKDVGQIAALRNTTLDTNELFVVTAGNQLGYLYQDPVSTLWKEMLIPLPDVGSALPYQCYSTHVSVADQNGNPVTKELSVAASEWTYLTVNGGSHIVDRDAPATVKPDPLGSVTAISKVSKLSTPTLNLTAPFLTETVDVNPQAVVNDNLKLFTTESALKEAKTQTGKPVVTGTTKIPVAVAAGALGQLTSLHDAAVSSGSSVTVRREGAPPSNQIDASALPDGFGFGVSDLGPAAVFHDAPAAEGALPHLYAHARLAAGMDLGSRALVQMAAGDSISAFFGDVMEAIENALEKVGGFLVSVVGDVVTFTIELADKIVSFVLDTVEKVMRVIGWVLEQLELALEKVIEWIGFIFDWDDILTAHKIIVNVANKTFEYAEDKISDAQALVASFFETLKAQFGALKPLSDPNASATVLGQSRAPAPTFPDAQKQNADYFKSPGGTFAQYHVQHSGILSGDPPPAPSSGNPILGLFTQVIEPVGKDIGKTVEDLMIDLRDGFVSGSSTPNDVVAKLRTDAVLGVLNTVEDAAEGVLRVADDAVASLQDVVDHPWDIPFLSPLYKQITKGSNLTTLDAVALLLAIPGVPMYKLVTERSPFENGTHRLDDTSMPAEEFFAMLGGSGPAPRAAMLAGAEEPLQGVPPAAILYSQIGGCFYLAAGFIAMVLDAVETESEGETPTVMYWLHLGCETVMQAGSFPVGDGEAVTILRILWGFYVAAMLRYVALMWGKATAEPAVGVFELFFALVKVIIFIAAIIVQTMKDSGTELALEWETFIGNLFDATSRGVSGAAKLDPDKEISGLALDVIAVLLSVVAILFDMVRLAIVFAEDEVDEFHCF